MKRTIAIIMSFILLVLLFNACGKENFSEPIATSNQSKMVQTDEKKDENATISDGSEVTEEKGNIYNSGKGEARELPERYHEEMPLDAWFIERTIYDLAAMNIQYHYFSPDVRDSILLQLFIHRFDVEYKYRCVLQARFRPDGLKENEFLEMCDKNDIVLSEMIPLHDDFNDRYCDRYYGDLTATQISAIAEYGDFLSLRVHFVGVNNLEKKDEWNDVGKALSVYGKSFNRSINYVEVPYEYMNYLSNIGAKYKLDEDYNLKIKSMYLDFHDFQNEVYKKDEFNYDIAAYYNNHELQTEIIVEPDVDETNADANGIFVKKSPEEAGDDRFIG